MEMKDIIVGRFYKLVDLGMNEHGGLVIGGIYECLAKNVGTDTISIREPAFRRIRHDGIRRLKPMRFVEPTAKELFTPGRVVFVKENAGLEPIPNNPGWIDQMDRMRGTVQTIRRVEPRNSWVKLVGDRRDLSYAPQWLRPATEEEVLRAALPPAAPVVNANINMGEPIAPPVGAWELPHVFPEPRAREDLKAVMAKHFDKVDAVAFKKGDFVRIEKKVERNDAGGVVNWAGDMDKTIGKVFVVDEVRWNKNIRLGMFIYLPECLKKISKEEYEKDRGPAKSLRELIAEQRKKHLVDQALGTASFVLFTKSKESQEIVVHEQIGLACHYSIQAHGYGNPDGNEVLAILDLIHDVKSGKVDECLKGTAVKYADYIINRSPFARAFEDKGGRAAVDNGVLVNVESPAAVVAGGLIALRTMREYRGTLYTFKLLTEAGVSEDAAYVMMHMYSGDGKDINLSVTGSHHSVINVDGNASQVLQFMANGYSPKLFKEHKPYRLSSSYSVWINVIHHKQAVDGSLLDYSRAVKTREVGDGWDIRNVVVPESLIQVAKKMDKQINGYRVAQQAKELA